MTDSSCERPVVIYTDGSCLGNPGPGGWAAVLLFNGKRKEISGGFRKTTNNRMEVLAVINALETLKRPCVVDLFTDSRYMHDAIVKKWIRSWVAKGWKTAAKKPVKNQDLWKRLLPLLDRHEVRFHWVRAHNGTPENERCDELAKQAAVQPGLPEDGEYGKGT
ncbi:MAG: ribonuclease HI [Desulfovibrionales bacterium]